jgi:DNA-binding PadR family transcriptional regulator
VSTPRITLQTLLVFALLLREGEHWYGLRIIREADLHTGTAYPLLHRMERAGWITSHWETPELPPGAGPRVRPRKYYELTEQGRKFATQAIETNRAHLTRRAAAARRLGVVMGERDG